MEQNHYLATIPTALISTIIELALIEEGEDPELKKNRISALKGELRKLYKINPNIQKYNRTQALLKKKI